MKNILSFQEACEFTGYAPSTMYKLTHSGQIPFSKPRGGKLFFEREKLEAWMLKNSVNPEANEQLAATYVSTHK